LTRFPSTTTSPPSLAAPLRVTIACGGAAHACSTAWYNDVATNVAQVAARGRKVAFSSVGPTSTRAFDLAFEDVVLAYTHEGNFATSQASLHAFIDAGGGVVLMGEALASSNPIVGFDYAEYAPIVAGTKALSSAALGAYNESEPIMSGVSSFGLQASVNGSSYDGYFGASVAPLFVE
jgi:hypothetical protein